MIDFDGDGPLDPEYRIQAGRKVSRGYARVAARSQRRNNIAILDLETDQFDNIKQEKISPFLAVIYSDQFETITIWNDDGDALIREVFAALEALPKAFTIYAHNGGKFDYMFFMHLLKGEVKFKGRALMTARLGKHEIRDSLHIIPESLRNANRKIDIDYNKFGKGVRENHKQEITNYCIEDCASTFEIVKAFIDKFGMPLTIGQAAMAELKRHYTFERLSESTDKYMRQWFFGGRVECLNNVGHYKGEYKLYDVHSMYPSVMAHERHPIGADFLLNDKITRNTAFIHLRCRNNGALMTRAKDGSLTSKQDIGEFFTTIHEYKAATELGLIANVRIIKTIDFSKWTSFANFVIPLYNRRAKLKAQLKADPTNKLIEQEIKFIKYLLNNCYGKLAQNCRRFKEYSVLPLGEVPDLEWLYFGVKNQEERMRYELEQRGYDTEEKRLDYIKRLRCMPEETTDRYAIWSIPVSEWRFNNVATAASITGAARAKLLRAIAGAIDPIYCDTDSIVCRELRGQEITNGELGTWNLEANISEFILLGKKIYGYRTVEGIEKIRAKGQQGVTWEELRRTLSGEIIRKTLKAPTISRTQTQTYMTRELRVTG